jgi:hypothetical protein
MKQAMSGGYSLPREHRWRVKSGYGKEASKRETLTVWRAQREGYQETKASKQTKGTHFLESANEEQVRIRKKNK